MTPIRTRQAHGVTRALDERDWTALMLRILAVVTIVTIAVAASACTGGNAGGSLDRPISAPPGRGS